MGNSKELIAKLEAERTAFYKKLDTQAKEDRAFSTPDDEPLTTEEIAQIHEYWDKYKFAYPNIDLKAFEAFKNRFGRFDVRYCPQPIYRTFFYPNLVSSKYLTPFRNKTLMAFLYPDIPKPRTIARRMCGIYYNEQYEPIDKEQFIEICCTYVGQNERMIVKPGGSYSGMGVVVLDHTDTTRDVIEQILTKDMENQDVVFQEVLKQSPFMDAFNPSSVNTVRIITLLVHGKVTPISAMIRVGKAGSIVDNWHAGGSVVGIDINSGRCNTWALGHEMKHITVLPSGLDLEAQELIVPNFEKLKEDVTRAHYRNPYLEFRAWDIALDHENVPTFIECNHNVSLPAHEVVSGAIFGEFLDDLLEEYLLKKFYFRFATEDLICREYHDHIQIETYAGDDGMVVIPERMRDKPVTAISAKAFEGKMVTKISAPPAMLGKIQRVFAATKS